MKLANELDSMRQRLLLVAANLVPLAGVLFWGWQVKQVVFLYWAENIVIGLFNLAAILGCEPGPDRRGRPSGWFDVASPFSACANDAMASRNWKPR